MWKSNLVRVDIFSGLKPLKHLCGWMGGDKSSYLWDWFWPETLCRWVRAPPPPGVQPTPPKRKYAHPSMPLGLIGDQWISPCWPDALQHGALEGVLHREDLWDGLH